MSFTVDQVAALKSTNVQAGIYVLSGRSLSLHRMFELQVIRELPVVAVLPLLARLGKSVLPATKAGSYTRPAVASLALMIDHSVRRKIVGADMKQDACLCVASISSKSLLQSGLEPLPITSVHMRRRAPQL